MSSGRIWQYTASWMREKTLRRFGMLPDSMLSRMPGSVYAFSVGSGYYRKSARIHPPTSWEPLLRSKSVNYYNTIVFNICQSIFV